MKKEKFDNRLKGADLEFYFFLMKLHQIHTWHRTPLIDLIFYYFSYIRSTFNFNCYYKSYMYVQYDTNTHKTKWTLFDFVRCCFFLHVHIRVCVRMYVFFMMICKLHIILWLFAFFMIFSLNILHVHKILFIVEQKMIVTLQFFFFLVK